MFLDKLRKGPMRNLKRCNGGFEWIHSKLLWTFLPVKSSIVFIISLQIKLISTSNWKNYSSDNLTWCSNDLTRCAYDMTWSANCLTRCANNMTWSANCLTRCANDLTRCANDLTRCANDLTSCAKDLTRVASNLTRSASNLTRSAKDLTWCAKNFTWASPRSQAPCLPECIRDKNDKWAGSLGAYAEIIVSSLVPNLPACHDTFQI